jgi:hypothetical protein
LARKNRTSARTPPPTFLFLPIHFSKNPTTARINPEDRRLVPGFWPERHARRMLAEANAVTTFIERTRGKPQSRQQRRRPRVDAYIVGGVRKCQHRDIKKPGDFCGSSPTFAHGSPSGAVATLAPQRGPLLDATAAPEPALTLKSPVGKLAHRFCVAFPGLAGAAFGAVFSHAAGR